MKPHAPTCVETYFGGRRSSIATLYCEKGSQEWDFLLQHSIFQFVKRAEESTCFVQLVSMMTWIHCSSGVLFSTFQPCFVYTRQVFFCTIPIHWDYSLDFLRSLSTRQLPHVFQGDVALKHLRIRRIRRMFQVVIHLIHCGTSILTCCFFFKLKMVKHKSRILIHYRLIGVTYDSLLTESESWRCTENWVSANWSAGICGKGSVSCPPQDKVFCCNSLRASTSLMSFSQMYFITFIYTFLHPLVTCFFFWSFLSLL